ncbi:putative chaperone DNAJ protein [Trypanosoma rangeli]|uniref:Putative chaperone DNAJ protein n=1 Tax=Trypanosoma rangeli TaxID=5698 RepID=A0A422NQ78_TRYRA|nr:putative chaperone DNAJ protein [Trypanosoma rangeli]RNF07638.1 putative chaperone DNAJ protein [Trypanosoma rangeli]|eukprot:RNF07638.1 putative chaperone DNAJ protein [Trypanosoma rangeli]
MQGTLSKEQLADFAQQAVTSLRRLIKPSLDPITVAQQELISTSKSIEESWRKKRIVSDTTLLDMWAAEFQGELIAQLEQYTTGNACNEGNDHVAGNDGAPNHALVESSLDKKNVIRKFIGESSMLTCMEALKILIRTNGDNSSELIIRFKLVTYMTKYLMQVPMSKRTRDTLASVLLEIAGYNSQLLEEALAESQKLLLFPEDAKIESVVTPQQVQLACLLAAAFRRADVHKVPTDSARLRCGRDGFLSGLIRTCLVVARGTAGGVGGGIQFTALVTYFGLVSGMVRGCAANKELCMGKHRDELVTLWVTAASNVSRVEVSLPVPTNVPGKDATLVVEGAQAWASELIEFLVEVATSDSFSLRRQALNGDAMHKVGGRNMLNNTGFPPLSPSSLSSPGVSRAARSYEFLSAHWDTLLAGGSAYVWRLASLLFNCVLSGEGCSFIAEALLCMDAQSTTSDVIYRSVIATLMLLCVATPRNAEVLADSPIIEALIARITCSQPSVFSHEVMILGRPCSPHHALNAYTVQTTVALMSLLSSLYVSETMLPKLLYVVEEMCVRQTSSIDADIVGSLLHVFTCAGLPRGVLFFPGSGSVVCMVDRFPTTRFNGYSFAAWIHPKCVWLEGSHLFSFTDGASGSSVTLMIMADGCSCSLMMRTRHSTEVTLSSIPDTSFPADAWTHVAFTHNMAGFSLFIDGRRTENSLSISFPKSPSKKDRLQFAFGGYRDESSFFGFIASIELFDGTLSERELQRIYQAGPRPARELPISCHPFLSVESQIVSGTNDFSVGVTGTLAGRNEGVSVHSVVACSPLDMHRMFLCENVVNWALRTLTVAKKCSTSFGTVAKLCVQFICTAMKLTTTEKELNCMVVDGAIVRLREQMHTWENIPIEVPAILISSTIPRGGGKVMRTHHTTQDMLSLLLDVVNREGLHPTAIMCILRELSDALLLPENVAIFRAVPGRFERILALSMRLPPECVECVIALVERLCKEPREMEQTLLFLLSTSASRTADFVKAEMLRMLFDIALTNTAMCDLIWGAFGNTGVSFLIRLVGGKNHSDEAVRIFALRIISLIHHTNKKFREHFMKSHGYEVLGAVMTGPASSAVPIGIASFNCLFQMAFDAFQPTMEGDAVMLHLQQAGSSKPRRRSTKQPEHSHYPTVTAGQTQTLQGYMPGLVSPELRVTRREYSFDVSHELTYGNDTRTLLDDTHRCPRSRGNTHVTLQVPQAIQTLLTLLARLLCGVGASSLTVGSTTEVSHPSSEGNSESNTAAHEDRGANNTADSASRVSIFSPMQEESTESITLRVLAHLEKIVDRTENGEMLLPFPWLLWLWGAVRPVINPASSSGNDMISKPAKKHAAAVQQRVRNIVRNLAILDLSRNSKAGIVRTLRQAGLSSFFTRLVLEEIVSHFTKSRCEIPDRGEAANIIKNLDYLFHGIEEVLCPLPLGLGLEIVNAISAIAVNNNAWVRTKMKHSSRLFETRKTLSFALLASTKKFSKLESATLTQLLGANGHEPNTIRVLLRRLITAASNCDADEVEVLIVLIRQLMNSEMNQFQIIIAIIGVDYRSFAELLCGIASGKNASMSSSQDRGVQGSNLSFVRAEGIPVEVPASDVIHWRLENKAQWEIIKQRVCAATNGIITVRGKGGSEDLVVSPSSKTRRAEERRQSIQNKVSAEVERITREVDCHLNVQGGNDIFSTSNNGFTKSTLFSDSTGLEIQGVLPL